MSTLIWKYDTVSLKFYLQLEYYFSLLILDFISGITMMEDAWKGKNDEETNLYKFIVVFVIGVLYKSADHSGNLNSTNRTK